MDEQRPLCVWVGHASSEEHLMQCSSRRYGEDRGEEEFQSWLEKAFGLEDFDEDFKDAAFLAPGDDLHETLLACSYGEQFADQLMQALEKNHLQGLPAFNSLLVAYGISHNNGIQHAVGDGIELFFVGNYQCCM